MRDLIFEEVIEVSGGEDQTKASKAGGWTSFGRDMLVGAIVEEAFSLAKKAYAAMKMPEEPPTKQDPAPGPVSGGGGAWVDPG